MLSFPSSRRSFLRLGALAVGSLALPALLRAGTGRKGKAVIMVYLNGGPSHLDMYDLKPDAPKEYRGEFKPIRTNVPGMDIGELLPMQAKIADKFALVRSMRFKQEGHTAPELYTGFLRGDRPSIGSVVSKLHGGGPLPPYVYLGDANHVGGPGFLGKAHEAYIPGTKAGSLGRNPAVPLDRLAERKTLLKTFDSLKAGIDTTGPDAFTARALEMVTSNAARDAFDISREPARVRERYGPGTEYLQARRLVEAGVPLVSITPRNHGVPQRCNGQWDHHDHIFPCLRAILPAYDKALSALLLDLHERGLADDVAVCVWGEMGRTPRVGTQRGTVAGRDHWPQSGFCLLAGGGMQTGQVIGATDARGESPKGEAHTPQNVLAT
ncbi:MAG: DUF1501 domain-containing protein, partial [Gemmataceae bacterium]|nr:DUF1501 domain-containing protein [Gemmataceae bacterium]